MAAINFDDAYQSLITAFNSGSIKQDPDGNYVYTDPDGHTNYMSAAGLEQGGYEAMLQLINPTLKLEQANIASQLLQNPSATQAAISGNEATDAQNKAVLEALPSLLQSQISTNNLTTGKNNVEYQTLDDWLANKKSEYNLSTTQNAMKLGLVDDEGVALESGYKTSVANDNLTQTLAKMGIELTPAQQQSLLSGYNLTTATNESGQKLLPYQEQASIADLQYKTNTSNKLNELLPSRISATKQYINASKTGVNERKFTDAVYADTEKVFGNAEEASNRDMARMGIRPGSGAYKNNSIEKASALTQSLNNAHQYVDSENYRRLGAVALMP